MRRRRLGRWGESIAALYLVLAGYRILARNWRCRRGEIDIVARKRGLFVFVEVRTRKRGALVDPLHSVDPAKMARVIRAATVFLASKGMSRAPRRFDVVALTRSGFAVPRLRHVRRAFDGGDVEAPRARSWNRHGGKRWSRG